MLTRPILILGPPVTLLVALLACSGTPPKPKPTQAAEADQATEPRTEPVPARKAGSISGTYRERHRIGAMIDGDWGEEIVTDTLRVFPARDGVHVEVELVQANFHTCTFRKPMIEKAAGHWEFRSLPGDDDGNCVASFTRDGKSLALTSEGCREYCGARARLEASFSYPPDDPDPEAFDCTRRCTELDECRAAEKIKDTKSSENCKSRCWKLSGDAAVSFDDCVREAADDCRTMLDC